MEENTITLIDEDGNENNFEILFNFDDEDNNKSYVIYFDPNEADTNEDGEITFMVSRYDENNNIFEVEDDAELEMVEEVLNTFFDEKELSGNE